MSLVPILSVFALPFLIVAGWAIFRLPRLLSGFSDLRRRRLELEAQWAELESRALELKQRRSPQKSPATEPSAPAGETIAEQPLEAPALTVNPFVAMLIKPAATIRQIVDILPQLHVMLLSCIYGINALLRLNDGMRNWQLDYVILLPIALIVGPVFGLLSVSLVSWCARTISSSLGGVATEHETQASLVWSLLPEIYTFPFTLATAIITSPDTGSHRADLVGSVLFWHLAASWAARGWSLVLWVLALAEVNRFSRWRAVAVVLLTAIVFVVAVLGLIGALFSFAKLSGQ
jgi:hypothetical protein